MADSTDLTQEEWREQERLANIGLDKAVQSGIGFVDLSVNSVNALTVNERMGQMTCMTFAAAVLRIRQLQADLARRN